jgi:transcriptional regulator with XRE-family HTH domain
LDIGEKIRVLRKIDKISQRELAEKSGISTLSLIRYEKGERTPSLDILAKIATVLKVPLEKLVISHDESFSYKLLLAIKNVLHEKEGVGGDAVLIDLKFRLLKFELDSEPLYDLSRNTNFELNIETQMRLLEYLYELDFRSFVSFCSENKDYINKNKNLDEIYLKSVVEKIVNFEKNSFDLFKDYLDVSFGKSVKDFNDESLKTLWKYINKILEFELHKLQNKIDEGE